MKNIPLLMSLLEALGAAPPVPPPPKRKTKDSALVAEKRARHAAKLARRAKRAGY